MTLSKKQLIGLAITGLLGICCLTYYGPQILEYWKAFQSETNLVSHPGVDSIALPAELWSFSAKWSPMGDQIAIIAQKRKSQFGITEIYIYDRITKDLKRVTFNDDVFLSTQMSWSSDGSMIAAVGQPLNQPDRVGIWLIETEGMNLHYLTRGAAVAWSPTQDRLAVVDIQRNPQVVKLYDLHKGEAAVVFEDDGNVLTLVDDLIWSPIQDELVISVRGNTSEKSPLDSLYLLNLDQFSLKPLFKNVQWGLKSPAWLPSGGWIAFIAQTSDGGVISVGPLTEECIMAWLPEDINAYKMDVSPEGTRIVYTFSGKTYTVDVQEATGTYALPSALHCP